MRVLILAFWFIWATSVFSEEKTKTVGISENIKEVLYGEGLQKAAEAIYRKDNPTVEEMSLAYFLVESEKTDLPFDVEKYESILLEKKSPSFYIYALNNDFISKKAIDLSYLFELYENGHKSAALPILKGYSNRDPFFLKKARRWQYSSMLISMIGEDVDDHPSLVFLLRHLFSIKQVSALIKRGDITCDNIFENLPVLSYFYELDENITKCGIDKDYLKEVETIFDLDLEEGRVDEVKVSDETMIKLDTHLFDNGLSEGWFSSVFEICDSYHGYEKKVCRYNAIYASLNCSLFYWKGLGSWERSKGYEICKVNHIFGE